MPKNNWTKIGKSRRAGLLAPLFSVYSRNSIGIGDLADLKFLVDWCEKIGCSILQLLPMNETGPTNCPYDAVSSFALEPVYISLEDAPLFKKRIGDLKSAFPTGKAHVDYAIKDAKLGILRDIYAKERIKESEDFKKFIRDNAYWIDDFALFKALKERYEGRPWYEWPDAYRNRDRRSLESFRKEYAREVEFQKWTQWSAFGQFREARAYAGSKGVFICGDLPILISRDSADVWAHPEFFKLEFAAGAPPDMYCAKGQRWGMPTYNWEAISADSFRYLKAKLKFAENFYDILRVDHVVGLFRIWSIPYNEPQANEGLNGSFDPPDENVWREHGSSILSVMCAATSMLLLAEDLGMIPKACPETLKELGIPGNDVQRWTKDWATRHDFLPPREYRELSVAMLSTHDTTNWAAWWENEAGTVDEELFVRRSRERGIDCAAVRDKLFDKTLSKHGRLRWLESVESVDYLVGILGKPEQDVKDFIDMYQNTYAEKEKLWKRLKLKGPMREKSDRTIVAAALKTTLASRSIFSIELLVDYLGIADVFKGDPYDYRINRPGTISKNNWSLVTPIPLEDLLKHTANKNIKEMFVSSGRSILYFRNSLA